MSLASVTCCSARNAGPPPARPRVVLGPKSPRCSSRGTDTGGSVQVRAWFVVLCAFWSSGDGLSSGARGCARGWGSCWVLFSTCQADRVPPGSCCGHLVCVCAEFGSKCCVGVGAEAPQVLAVWGSWHMAGAVQGQGLACPLCHLPAFTWLAPAGCCRFYA